jgi:hypothetical protein
MDLEWFIAAKKEIESWSSSPIPQFSYNAISPLYLGHAFLRPNYPFGPQYPYITGFNPIAYGTAHRPAQLLTLPPTTTTSSSSATSPSVVDDQQGATGPPPPLPLPPQQPQVKEIYEHFFNATWAKQGNPLPAPGDEYHVDVDVAGAPSSAPPPPRLLSSLSVATSAVLPATGSSTSGSAVANVLSPVQQMVSPSS